jgi:cyclophilin family peptidyl-prolyl cis-trans isomerase
VVLLIAGGTYLATLPEQMPGAPSADAERMAQEFADQYGSGAEREVASAGANAASAGPNAPDGAITINERIMHATLHTNHGDITIEFYPERTPNTVENFIKLAKSGFYDGTKFHRVIKGFMIQGGDPLTKDDAMQSRWGTGGPGYKFNDEIMPDNRNDVGTISMANAGPNTNGSQFFINVADNDFLDGKHTVFGRVVAGMDVVGKIENTQTGPGDRPVEPVIIESVTLAE